MEQIQQLYKFDTATLSDALDACGVEGALLGIKPLISGVKMIGYAYTVKYLSYDQPQEKFQNAGNYIDNVAPNAVIIIDNQGRNDCTSWGNILTQTAIIKNIAGTVIYGSVRDVDYIKKNNYPVFANNIYMRSGKNRVYKAQEQCELIINNVIIKPNDIIVGDDNGVIVISKELLSDVIIKAKNIQKTENKILAAVMSGMKLEEARKQFKYDQPWLENKNE
jgi:regulator of RNase E activity RraA